MAGRLSGEGTTGQNERMVKLERAVSVIKKVPRKLHLMLLSLSGFFRRTRRTHKGTVC